MTDHHPRSTWIPEDLNPQNFTTVPDLLDYCVKQYSDKPAFSCMGQTLTYSELASQARQFATYLQTETKLQPGDRIAIQLPNILQYPIVLFGAMAAGLVVVNTNPLYTSREMKHQFKDSGAKALVIYQPMADKAEAILADTDVEHVFLTQLGDIHGFVKRHLLNFVVRHVKKMQPAFNLPSAKPLLACLSDQSVEKFKPVTVASPEVAVLQYTGGTTGVAKGAVLTHANLVSNMLQGGGYIGQAGEGWADTVIAPLPLYHIYAFTVAQAVMYHGGHSVLIPNPRDIPGFVKEMKKWQPSAFLGLNTLFVALCNNPEFAAVDFSRLILTASGGMPLTKAAAERWEKVTECEIVEGYGLTETSPIVSMNIPKKAQIGTIGLALPHTQTRIIDAEERDVPEGERGELCVKGPQVMQGYWQRESATEESFTSDGYFKTGDIALQEANGALRIVDRAKDMIIVSGFNVYPNEIEDLVSTHPDVLECAAIGVPHETCGEVVKLFVVKSGEGENLTEKALRGWCREQLTAYKVPRSIVFREDLPKSNVGKILRRELRDETSSDGIDD